MNEFLEQFLVESRELVAQATDDLLALEEQPQDSERLGSAFRAFHTLKGAAGIMDFDAMGRALHAAEDVLSSARDGSLKVTPGLVSDCLSCLDQVVQWLDAAEAAGDMPSDAGAAADALIARLQRNEPRLAPAPAAPQASWAQALAARHPDAGPALLALRYAPGPDSFYEGVDPIDALRAMPGLIALEFVPPDPWPPLETLDPFACRISFLALFSEDSPALQAQLARLGAEAEVAPLASREPGQASDLPPPACELIEAQIAMLQAAGEDGLAGRVSSAARVASNVLRRLGREAQAAQLEHVALAATGDPAPLIQALEAVLAGGGSPTAPLDAFAAASADAPARGVRVDVERVNALVSLAGELTVAKNALGHAADLARAGTDAEALGDLLKTQHAQLDRLVAELQRAVLNMRLLPLRHVFQRFPRLVREMVVALDRPARLVTEGDDTEADKAVVESLFEPLLHVLRNALDHGVESVEDRAAAGKPPSATITIRARREGDRVLVEVQDDGRGIDVAHVAEAAVARDLVTPAALETMSEDEVRALIFAPGFSTAKTVTALSGRGVGMDAVRSVVERLGGRVSVESTPGAGALVRFSLPFTVMMTRVMTVEAGGQVFGIPLEAVIETVRLPRERIMPVGGARAFVHRDRTIPLIDLAQTLGERRKNAENEVNVVVATASGHLGGLEVDRLGERMDVMLRPLGGLLAATPGVAGATLLGDGRVLLVLDLEALLQ